MESRKEKGKLSLPEKAQEVSSLLKSLAHPDRLQILCLLVEAEEVSVGQLVESLGVGQSWVSQILQRMRMEGLINSRKTGQYVFYRVENPALREIILALHSIFCKKEKKVWKRQKN